MAQRVLLLRTPASPPETDPYEAALTRASFRPLSLPVLETVLENVDRLSRIIRGEDEGRVDAVIVTSARAVDACANAGVDTDWRAVRFYVVGHATAAALARLRTPPQDVRGMECGTAERLARYIVGDARREERLLYLTGDKNRETLARVVREGLGEEGVLRELRVYATRGVGDFEGRLSRALEGETVEDGERWWIVFFAPSAAAHAMPALRAHFSMAAREGWRDDGLGRGRAQARVAAIGGTTGDYLSEHVGLIVDAVAERPSGESLTAALIQHSLDNGQHRQRSKMN
ncbi:tetrapyrrole biosynthesis, uroporphyrinogen III synthase [Russula earlei]|uniref:Tetrapyrrole biosynthesis, uroporphyrinogen III synthase n=1 Tax=Russula earlei TaxID=71964 RepID=A0ACC0U5E9_9AGAM|nr:tetrapyrrole biosynthesis, uroporphyrinogen III synthase [Russula earlei]